MREMGEPLGMEYTDSLETFSREYLAKIDDVNTFKPDMQVFVAEVDEQVSGISHCAQKGVESTKPCELRLCRRHEACIGNNSVCRFLSIVGE